MQYRRMWPAFVVVFFVGPAYAQDAAPAAAPAMTASANATALVDAFKGHQWALVAALCIYMLASLSKQGWLGTWLHDHLPRRTLPFLAPLIGLLLLTTGEMIFGKVPWPTAILDGFLAGWLPIIGHEVVVESMRGGKEIVPKKLPDGGSSTNMPDMTRTDEVLITEMPTTPPRRNERTALMRLVAAFVFAVLLACTPQERADVKTIIDFVLSGSQLACVEMATLRLPKEVAEACQIDLQASPGIEAFLDNLLAQKAAAHRSGFEWHGTHATDAGSP